MTNRKFLRSARAAVGATSTKGGGRTAKPGDHKRNRGRAASAGVEVQVQKIPAHVKNYENIMKI